MGKIFIRQTVNASSVLGWLKLHGILTSAALLCPVLLIVTQLMALRSVENYSLVRDSISLLAWTGIGWFQNTTFLVAGFLLEGFSAVLLFGIRGAKGFNLGIILLACSGFNLILVGIFPTDLPIAYFPPTINGAIHGIASNSVFILLPLSSLLIAPSLKKNPHWRPLFLLSIVTAVFAFVWIAVYRLYLPEQLSWFGLYERILVGDELIWVELMAIWLLRLFQKSVQPARPDSKVPVLYIRNSSLR